MTARSTLKTLSLIGVILPVVVLVVLVWLGFEAPRRVNQFSYVALVICGTGAVGLLFSGIGVRAAGVRRPTFPQQDLQFFVGIRRLVLAMLICVLAVDVFGILLMLMVVNISDGSPKVGNGWLSVVFIVVAATIIYAGVVSVVVRRLLPSDPVQLAGSNYSIFGE